jgi:transposase InsO family protein
MGDSGSSQPILPNYTKSLTEKNVRLKHAILAASIPQMGDMAGTKMWKELLARGIRAGKERVRKMMKLHGIKAKGKKKFVVTTDSTPPAHCTQPA